MFMMVRGSCAALKATCGSSPLTSNCIRNHLGRDVVLGQRLEQRTDCLSKDVSLKFVKALGVFVLHRVEEHQVPTFYQSQDNMHNLNVSFTLMTQTLMHHQCLYHQRVC